MIAAVAFVCHRLFQPSLVRKLFYTRNEMPNADKLNAKQHIYNTIEEKGKSKCEI
jgi:hypothetical protein